MKKFGIILGIIIILLGLGLFLWNYFHKKNKPTPHILSEDVDGLIQIKYSSSGDSNGNIDHTILYIQDKMVVTEKKNYIQEPLSVSEYSVTEEEIQDLEKDIEKYNYPLWKDIPINTEFIALDAPSTSICFIYHKKGEKEYVQEYYCVSHNADLSKKQREQLRSFEQKLFALVKEETKIKSYQKKDE